MNVGYDERASDFFLEYVKPYDRGLLTGSCNLTLAAMKQAVRLLLEEGVFESEDEIKAQAVKDINVILPCELFE